jgi:hypothetical protein
MTIGGVVFNAVFSIGSYKKGKYCIRKSYTIIEKIMLCGIYKEIIVAKLIINNIVTTAYLRRFKIKGYFFYFNYLRVFIQWNIL